MNRRSRFHRSFIRRAHVAQLLSLLFFGLCWPLLALGQDAPTEKQPAEKSDRPQFTSISVGVENRYKSGNWTPVEFTVQGGAEPVTVLLSVTVADGDGYPSAVTSPQPTLILPGRETRLSIDVKPGRVDGSFSATLLNVEDGREVAEETFDSRYEADAMHPLMALSSNEQLIATLGPGIGVETALRLQGLSDGGRTTVLAAFRDASALPTRWIGYDGIDLLVLSTSDPSLYRALVTDSTQLAALEQWVRLGGNLLLCVGSQALEILAERAPLARFAPGTFVEMTPLTNLAPLEEYAEDTNAPIVPPNARADERRVQVPRLENVVGDIEARAGNDLPLVVRRAYGLGHVTFVAVDLDRAPFRDWKARDKFVSRLLGYPTRPPVGDDTTTPANAQNAYNDIATVLRGKLDEFEGIRIAPFWLVAVLVFGYIVLIGPVDYFLVRHVFKRMELTWITFPVMVLAISAGAYALAFWMKGDQLRVNQVDVLDVDVANGLMRGTSWWNVFSPQSTSYDVTIQPVLPDGATDDDAQEIVAWLGAGGSTIGGAYRSAGDPPLWARPYNFAPQLDAMLGVPIQVWSTKSFRSQWQVTDQDRSPAIESSLFYVDNDSLAGELRSRLKVPLADCLVAHDIWVYPLGNLAADEEGKPSQTIDLAQIAASRVRLERWISQQDVTAENADANVNVYFARPGDYLDAPNLVMRMLFFDAAGGEAKLSMMNQLQDRLDLSQNLRPGFRQAILVGRVDVAGRTKRVAAHLLLDEKVVEGPLDKHWVLYRFILPVENE